MKVLGVEEEEYCYIPMGGELPDLTQRVVGFGGAANMVHPATGTYVP
jgi:lycopene beta-cyclase